MASLRPLLLTGLAAVALALPIAAAKPVAAQQQIAAVTATRVIGEREIGKRIAEMVRDRNGGRPVEISFHGMGNELEVSASAFNTLQVESFAFDPRSGRFYAQVSAQGAEAIKVSGRAQQVEAIPVLKNRINAGQVIARGDIEWLQVPANRYGAGYIDKVEEMIGQTPKRALAAGIPVRSVDIGKPEAITKNGLVTMVAQAPGMTITTTGRAMETGSIGDVVQVMNLQSKRTVQATVTGLNLVQVITAPSLIASN